MEFRRNGSSSGSTAHRLFGPDRDGYGSRLDSFVLISSLAPVGTWSVTATNSSGQESSLIRELAAKHILVRDTWQSCACRLAEERRPLRQRISGMTTDSCTSLFLKNMDTAYAPTLFTDFLRTLGAQESGGEQVDVDTWTQIPFILTPLHLNLKLLLNGHLHAALQLFWWLYNSSTSSSAATRHVVFNMNAAARLMLVSMESLQLLLTLGILTDMGSYSILVLVDSSNKDKYVQIEPIAGWAAGTKMIAEAVEVLKELQ
jgi:hypothetical protein